MLNLQEIYKLCDGFDGQDRKTSIQKLKRKGFSEETANNFYNIWKRHYMETSITKDLKLSGIYVQKGIEKKLIEECSYKERQKYLEALSKEQLIKLAQAILK